MCEEIQGNFPAGKVKTLLHHDTSIFFPSDERIFTDKSDHNRLNCCGSCAQLRIYFLHVINDGSLCCCGKYCFFWEFLCRRVFSTSSIWSQQLFVLRFNCRVTNTVFLSLHALYYGAFWWYANAYMLNNHSSTWRTMEWLLECQLAKSSSTVPLYHPKECNSKLIKSFKSKNDNYMMCTVLYCTVLYCTALHDT